MTMQAIFVQDGESLDYTPTAYTPAGTVIVQGPMVGITKHEIQPNILGAIAADGVFYVEKDNSAFSGGGPIYWNPAGNPLGDTAGGGCATSTASGATFMGFVVIAALSTDTRVYARLRSVESSAAETLGLNDLANVSGVVDTAGNVLVGQGVGSGWTSKALTGPFTLSGNGKVSMAVGSVAATGTNQATAAALADGFNLVTGADGTKAVVLPAGTAGRRVEIKNIANAVLPVFPAGSNAINALSPSAALNMAAYSSCTLVTVDGTTWYSNPTVPS